MTPGRFSSRERVAVAAVLLAAATLTIRLGGVQFGQRVALGAAAAKQRVHAQPLPARPGDVTDRHGRLLATTVLAPSVYLVPRSIDDERVDAVTASVAGVLGLNAAELRADVLARRDRWFLWAKRRVSPETIDALREADLPPGTWGVRDEYLRRYPRGTLAGQVVGWRDLDGNGRAGVERGLDPRLRGTDGVRVTARDARGRTLSVRDAATRPPDTGRGVRLTIDAALQAAAESELDRIDDEFAPAWSAAVLLEVGTGELLAAASRPAFDPGRAADFPDAAWVNRACGVTFEPGSTVKPLFLAWALRAGVVDWDERIDCELGRWDDGRRVLHDSHPHGVVTPAEILVRSSNIGTAKIARRLGNAGLHAAAAAFGFGRRTGVALPGEAAGFVRPLSEWDHYSTGSVPMGHEFTVTALQLAAAHAALADGGTFTVPRILPADADAPPVRADLFDPAVARRMIAGPLTDVIDRGTGRRARSPTDVLFGKTGTAQKYDAELGRFSPDRTVASAVVGGPSDTPRLIAVVVADDPAGDSRGGGTVAAPAAARLVTAGLRRLGVPPSR